MRYKYSKTRDRLLPVLKLAGSVLSVEKSSLGRKRVNSKKEYDEVISIIESIENIQKGFKELRKVLNKGL